jgi:hypothetical protein
VEWCEAAEGERGVSLDYSPDKAAAAAVGVVGVVVVAVVAVAVVVVEGVLRNVENVCRLKLFPVDLRCG